MKKNRLAYTNGWYINVGHYCIFGSYNTYIALYDYNTGRIYKDEAYYSSSTSRQYNRWCREIIGLNPKDKEFIRLRLNLISNDVLCDYIKRVLK